MSWKGWSNNSRKGGWNQWYRGKWDADHKSNKNQKKADREQAIAQAVAMIQAEFSLGAVPAPPLSYAQVASLPPGPSLVQPSASSPPQAAYGSPQAIEERKQRALKIGRLVCARDALDKDDPERIAIEGRLSELRASSRGEQNLGERLDSAILGAAEARLKVTRAKQQLQLQREHLTKVEGELVLAEQELQEARAGVTSSRLPSIASSDAAFGIGAVRQVLEAMGRCPQEQLQQLPPQIREGLDTMRNIAIAYAPLPAQPEQPQQAVPGRPPGQDTFDLELQAQDDARLAAEMQQQFDAMEDDHTEQLTDEQLQEELQRLSPGFRKALGRRLRQREKGPGRSEPYTTKGPAPAAALAAVPPDSAAAAQDSR